MGAVDRQLSARPERIGPAPDALRSARPVQGPDQCDIARTGRDFVNIPTFRKWRTQRRGRRCTTAVPQARFRGIEPVRYRSHHSESVALHTRYRTCIRLNRSMIPGGDIDYATTLGTHPRDLPDRQGLQALTHHRRNGPRTLITVDARRNRHRGAPVGAVIADRGALRGGRPGERCLCALQLGEPSAYAGTRESPARTPSCGSTRSCWGPDSLVAAHP